MTWPIISLKVNWEMWISERTSIAGRYTKSSVPRPAMSNLEFSQRIVIPPYASDSIEISLSGSFLTIAEKSEASIATEPGSVTNAVIVVSIPSDISFAVSFSVSSSACKRTQRMISMVVRTGIARETMFMALFRFSFEHRIFILETSLFPQQRKNKCDPSAV